MAADARGPKDIFDRRLRAQARGRTAPGEADFLLRHAAEELRAREALLPPAPEGPALAIGACGLLPGIAADLNPRRLPPAGPRLLCEEDRLPFADGSLAVIRSLLMLHGVNDLPGALLLARRALRPGGRYLAVLAAGVSAGAVRAALTEADMAAGGVAARVGPTVDPAHGAGLLQRAGFQDPVAEVVPVAARYATLRAFARDTRAMGETGWLVARSRLPMTRGRWAAAEAAFAQAADAHGKVTVEAELLFLSARAPSRRATGGADGQAQGG
jgi:NADH dehydrogenase [ubiquinone] 1 alpha subcomplex assembly factor 5